MLDSLPFWRGILRRGKAMGYKAMGCMVTHAHRMCGCGESQMPRQRLRRITGAPTEAMDLGP
eukprot:365227-Chlamydomonas_euryale.AAC.3